MMFESYKNNKLTLIKSSEIDTVPENILSEFKLIFKKSFKKEIEVFFQDGNVTNTPMLINDISEKKDQDIANKSLYEDKDIKDFMKKFGGKIKEETIKPIK
jgi:hypothetical protein